MQAQVARLPSARSNIPSRPLPSRHENFNEIPPTHPPPQDSNIPDSPATEADRNPQPVGYLSRLRRVTSRIPRPGQSMDGNENSEGSNGGEGRDSFVLSNGYLEQLSPKGMDPGRFASIREKFEAMQLAERTNPQNSESALRKCRSSVARQSRGGGGGGRGRGRGGSRTALRSYSARYAMLDSVGSLTGVSSSNKDYGKPIRRDGESSYRAADQAGVFGNMYVLDADESVEKPGRGGQHSNTRDWIPGMDDGRGALGSSGECSGTDATTDDSDADVSAVRYHDDSARYPRPLADQQWKERLERNAAEAVAADVTAEVNVAAPTMEACGREFCVASPVTPMLEDRLVSVEEVDGENSCRDALEYEQASRELTSIIGAASNLLYGSDCNPAADASECTPEGVEVGGRDQNRGYQNSDGQLQNADIMEWGNDMVATGEAQHEQLLRSSISTAVAAVDELREQLTSGAGKAYRLNQEPPILEERDMESEGEGEEAIAGVRRTSSKGQQNGSFDSMWSVDFPDPAGIISPASNFVEVFNSYGYSEDMPSSLFTRDAMDSVGIDKAWDHLFPKPAARRLSLTGAVEEGSFDNQNRSESRDGTYLELECCPADEVAERFPDGLGHQFLYLGSAPEFTGLDDAALESTLNSVTQSKAWTTECDRAVFDEKEDYDTFDRNQDCRASCSTHDSESTYCSSMTSTSCRDDEKTFGDPLPFCDPVFQSIQSEFAASQNGTGRSSYSWSGDPWKNLRLASAAEKVPHSARDTFDRSARRRPPIRFDVCLRSAEPSPKSHPESSRLSSSVDNIIEFPPPPMDIEYHSTSESVEVAMPATTSTAVVEVAVDVVDVDAECEVIYQDNGQDCSESVVACSIRDDDAMATPMGRRKFKFYTKMMAMMKLVVPKRKKASRKSSDATSSRDHRQGAASPQLVNGCMPKLLHWRPSQEHSHIDTNKLKKKKHAKNKGSTSITAKTKAPHSGRRITKSFSESDGGSSRRRLSASLRSSTKGSVRGSGSSSHKYSRRHMFIMDKIENERLGMNAQPRTRRGVVRESIDMLWMRHLSKTS